MSRECEKVGFDRRMKKDEINQLPLFRYTDNIHLIQTTKELSMAVEALHGEDILGFDTETKPAFSKGESYPPALIQIASSEAVYIFQLNAVKFRQKIRAIFAKKTVVKAGVATEFDVRQLQTLGKFRAAGFVDLATMAKALGIKNFGLRGLAAVLLGTRVAKGAKKSNWANRHLSEAQICYAATDAWVSREIYLRLKELEQYGPDKGLVS